MIEFDEDAYMERELDRYLNRGYEQLSNCCEASFIGDTDICSECLEHTISIKDDYENYQIEKADEDRKSRYDND